MTAIKKPANDEASLEMFDYVSKHAEEGVAEAQYHLALMYDSGRGVERSPKKALFWYAKAADQGNADAMYYLGRMYESQMSGIKQDLEKAAKWYSMAAEKGHSQAKARASFMVH